MANEKGHKKNRQSRDKIANRLLSIAEITHEVELIKAFYFLEKKIMSNNFLLGNVDEIDREINRLLDELPEYLSAGNSQIINNYISRLNKYIELRGQLEKGEVPMKKFGEKIRGLFGPKEEAGNSPADDERMLFDLQNRMFAELDKADKTLANRKKIIDEAKKLPPGDPREKVFALQIESCDNQYKLFVSGILNIGKTISAKTSMNVAKRYEELMKNLDDSLQSPDELEKTSARIGVFMDSFTEKSTRTDEIMKGIIGNGESAVSEGSLSPGLEAINEARAQDEALKDLEEFADTAVTANGVNEKKNEVI